MLKRGWLRFVWVAVLTMLALVFSGCAPSYVVIASSSYLPSAAQVEEQTIRESIPPDLRKRLKKTLAESQAQAANVGRNKQYLGQTIPHPQTLLERKLVETVLEWAGEKPPEERLVLQKRRSAFEAIVEESRAPDKPEATWRDHRHVQYGAGVVAGAAIGTVPLGPYAADVAIELKVLPKGTYYARVGKCAGELISGVIQMAVGCSGMTTGVAMTGTGGGAPAGVVVISATFALALNGYATAAHAFDEAQRLWKEGPPPDAPAPPEQLLKPKTRPKQPTTTAPPAQAAPAKPVQPAKPAQAVTRDKSAGKVVKAQTTETPKQTQAPTQAGAGVKPKGAKRGPKTDPDAPHNAAVRKEAEKLQADGNKIVAGGRVKPEQLVETNGGKKSGRRPDIIYEKPGEPRRGRNVGKTNADGAPVKREQEALDDLNNHSKVPTDFVPYTR